MNRLVVAAQCTYALTHPLGSSVAHPPSDETRWRASRIADLAAPALLVALVVALAIPYAVAGPQIILDDWFFLRNAHFDGAWSAGGARQLNGRPGAWLIYAFQFGFIGRRPMVLLALQTMANAAVAVALLAAARRFVDRRLALAIAAVWVLLPNHASLTHWFSTLPAVVALLLVLLGVLALDRARYWTATAAFAAAVLCYEAVIPVAMFVLVAVPVLRRRRIGAEVLAGLLVMASLTLWVWSHRIYPGAHDADFTNLFPIHFGSGITAWGPGAVILSLVAAAAITLAFARLALPSFRARTGMPERLILAGILIIGVGSAAFFRWPWTITGINDRANLVGSIGAATTWVGVAMTVARVNARVVLAGALAAAIFVVPTHLQRSLDYRRAGDDARRVLGAARSAPVVDGEILLDWRKIRSHHEVYGLFDWMAPHAVQLVRDDPTVSARFIVPKGG